jgi:hypothetical protein
MKMSEMAKLAAKNKKSIPNLIEMIATSLENTDNRLVSIENAIRKISSEYGGPIAEFNALKPTIIEASEEISILKVWLNDKTLSSVGEVQPTDQLVMVKQVEKPVNDGMLPADRKAALASE